MVELRPVRIISVPGCCNMFKPGLCATGASTQGTLTSDTPVVLRPECDVPTSPVLIRIVKGAWQRTAALNGSVWQHRPVVARCEL